MSKYLFYELFFIIESGYGIYDTSYFLSLLTMLFFVYCENNIYDNNIESIEVWR